MQSTRVLERGDVVPSFSLPSHRGTKVSFWDYRQQKNFVIVFVHRVECRACRALLGRLKNLNSDYRNLNAEIMCVSQDDLGSLKTLADELELPFPLLSDREGRVFRKLLGSLPAESSLPAVLVTDRFGELYYVGVPEDGAFDEPELRKTLQWIELRCPECESG